MCVHLRDYPTDRARHPYEKRPFEVMGARTDLFQDMTVNLLVLSLYFYRGRQRSQVHHFRHIVAFRRLARSALCIALSASVCLASPCWFTHTEGQAAVVRKFLADPHAILRSVPALRIQEGNSTTGSTLVGRATEVRVTVVKRVQKVADGVLQGTKGPLSSAGLYYGLSADRIGQQYGNAGLRNQGPTNKKNASLKRNVRDTMAEALEELRLMRMEMEALRRELHMMQTKVQFGEGEVEGPAHPEGLAAGATSRQKRRREFEKISNEIEKWAEEVLSEDENDGWAEVKCNKMFQGMNRDGRTRTYLKWMKDSRGKNADESDQREYPCIKMYSTIDAPLEEVCLYLAQARFSGDYNELIDSHKDLEEISPHSKICHGQTPQILFLKPRDFVTFCSHRWLHDGTQVVVNQACDDPTGKIQSKNRPMAYAIRGANFISRHPDYPDKTRILMLAHGNPGRDVPMWAMKTAVNSLAPIEPFKLFHKINQGVLNNRQELENRSCWLDEAELVSSGGMTRRPAGLAQLGYACFWPNGGGIQEGAPTQNLRQRKESSSPELILNHSPRESRGVDPPDQLFSVAPERSAPDEEDSDAGENNREKVSSQAWPAAAESLASDEYTADREESSSSNLAPVVTES